MQAENIKTTLMCWMCSFDNSISKSICECCGNDLYPEDKIEPCPVCTFMSTAAARECSMCNYVREENCRNHTVDLTGEDTALLHMSAETLQFHKSVLADRAPLQITTAQCGTQCVRGVVEALASHLQAEASQKVSRQCTLSVAASAIAPARDACRGHSGLCSPTVLYSQRSTSGSKWTCGYRNIQMAVSCLIRVKSYRHALVSETGGLIPTVGELQRLITAAWRTGFDPEGAAQLGNRLTGKSIWIGATECAVYFRFHGIRAVLVDVPSSDSAGARKRKLDAYSDFDNSSAAGRLGRWVLNYFTDPSFRWNLTDDPTFLPPLYLQHNGHSRTIIGFEVSLGETFLLVMDPAYSATAVHDALAAAQPSKSWHKLFRVSLKSLNRYNAYQIVYFREGMIDESEKTSYKILSSERI